jgi:hypothetical protein
VNDYLRPDLVDLARKMTLESWTAIMSGGMAVFYVEHSGDRLSYGLEWREVTGLEETDS